MYPTIVFRLKLGIRKYYPIVRLHFLLFDLFRYDVLFAIYTMEMHGVSLEL